MKTIATTSLSQALERHQEFCNDQLKEKNFFSFASNYAKGINWYIKTFPQECRTKSDSLTLDATPSYVCIENVPSLMAKVYKSKELAQKKFILILRDPVARLVINILFSISDSNNYVCFLSEVF